MYNSSIKKKAPEGRLLCLTSGKKKTKKTCDNYKNFLSNQSILFQHPEANWEIHTTTHYKAPRLCKVAHLISFPNALFPDALTSILLMSTSILVSHKLVLNEVTQKKKRSINIT